MWWVGGTALVCLIFQSDTEHLVQQLKDVEDVTSGQQKNHKKPSKSWLQRSEWKNHSDRGRRYGRRCPPLDMVCYTAPTRLAPKLFVHCVKTFYSKCTKYTKTFVCHVSRGSYFWLVIKAVLSFLSADSFLIVDSWGRLACWATCSSRTRKGMNNMKERLWLLTNQWYFMIAAEIFDILFIRREPINPNCPVGTCTKLFKLNLKLAGVCKTQIRITLFCW